jgi:hypothetical protein
MKCQRANVNILLALNKAVLPKCYDSCQSTPMCCTTKIFYLLTKIFLLKCSCEMVCLSYHIVHIVFTYDCLLVPIIL